ncbi:uncharacterized protein LOC135172409 isoform X1 [Diachasmimorpha longicaudata]|uniref:uncharacterized protein LOC135172236 n=2 Tax=Diachasmimorpha longicaudata TaxID=58733 RepID=UPI0030B8A87A
MLADTALPEFSVKERLMTLKRMMTAILVLLFINTQEINGLVGYDCSGSTLNITSYSLLQVGQCHIPLVKPKSTNVNIELMQLNKYGQITVVECRLQLDRTIHRCGMFSHVAIVHNYRREYFVELEQHECQKLHDSNSLQISHNIVVDALVKNITNLRPITIAGKAEVDGTCQGSQYNDPFGNWDEVIVNAIARIYYTSYVTTVELISNKVTLQSGAKCDFLAGSCTNSLGTQAFWSVQPPDDCKFGKYTTLYRGSATKIESDNSNPTTYLVTTRDYTFTLEQRSKTLTCGYLLIQTELPKLFIMEVSPGTTFPTNKIINTDNVDLMQYVNTKIVYLEHHLRTQVRKLYHYIRLSQCEAQRTSLMNALSTASFAPDIFAYNLMKGPGYHAITTGELVSIVKCTAVPVTLRKSENCYQEMPVTYNNESYFLTGISRMLIRHGTVIDCHSAIPTVYRIDGYWYALNPDPMKTPTPATFNPSLPIEWEYEKIENLATSGIYSETDMEKLRDRLLTRAEAATVMNNLVSAANGNELPAGTISMKHLLSREMVEEMTESAAYKTWEKLKIFGNTVSILIGIVTIIHVIIGIANVFIHGFTLHDAFGWSFRILGALFGGLTHYFIYRTRRNQTNNLPENIEAQPLNTEMRTHTRRTTPLNTITTTSELPRATLPNPINPQLLSQARIALSTAPTNTN